MNKKTLIIIPTYNEGECVYDLVNSILKNISHVDLLFIDDNSKDDTQKIIENHIKIHPEIKLIKRPGKMGLASAYIDGFEYAVNNHYDIIIQMDADLSHHPKYLNSFLQSINEHDFVIGSRYIKGGGIKNWGKLRKMISFLANLYARTILQQNVKDLTGGFNCWRREVLESLDLRSITTRGYSFLVEIKYRALLNGFNHCEIPIIFEDRTQGKSKFNVDIFLEAILKIWALKLFKKKLIRQMSS